MVHQWLSQNESLHAAHVPKQTRRERLLPASPVLSAFPPPLPTRTLPAFLLPPFTSHFQLLLLGHFALLFLRKQISLSSNTLSWGPGLGTFQLFKVFQSSYVLTQGLDVGIHLYLWRITSFLPFALTHYQIKCHSLFIFYLEWFFFGPNEKYIVCNTKHTYYVSLSILQNIY